MLESPENPVAVSWSGGKDSMLARLRAQQGGATASLLVTMFDEHGASKSHALPRALLQAQADALGAELLVMPSAPGRYGDAFDAVLRAVRERGIERMVFGDIDLQAHRDWIEPACASAGVQPLFPLWGQARAALARQIVACGIRARVICVDTQRLGARWCGREYDAAFIDSLPPSVCACGEDGEFHTVVWDGPGFAVPLALNFSEVRSEPSQPPLASTVLAWCTPALQ
jgi:diphthine-ammonia ligase